MLTRVLGHEAGTELSGAVVLKVIRHRPFQAVVIALLAALITTCAVFAPLYDRAIQQALVDIKLDQATIQSRGLQLTSVVPGGNTFQAGPSTGGPLDVKSLQALVPASVRRAFQEPVPSTTAQVTPEETPAAPGGSLTWRAGACAHLRLVAGRCPTAAGEILVSRADAANFRFVPGATVTVGVAEPRVGQQPPKLSVVGVYTQPEDDYWFGQTLTGRSNIVDRGPPPSNQHDVWLTAAATFTSPSIPQLPDLTTQVDLPLDVARAGVDDVLRLGPDIEGLTRSASREGGGTAIGVHSALPEIAGDVRAQRAQSRITVPLLMVQLGLLAVVVLWLVLGAATEQRRPEVALAMLRGRGTSGARRLLLGELVPIVLTGVPLGLGIALLLSWLTRHVFLPGAAPFELGIGFVLALVAAVVVLVATVVLAARAVAHQSVETLLRSVPTRGSGWALGVLDAVVITMAGTAVVAFVTGGLSGPLALAAPALLALVVGLLLSHLTTPVAARLGQRLLARGAVRAGVSLLDAARTPATRRTVAVLTVATALLVFSADAVVVGARNRSNAAEQVAGAPLVAEVSGNDLPGVRAALAQVDPSGRSVTPVVKVLPPGRDAPTTLAVVPSQFRRIALLADDVRTGAPWNELAPPRGAPIRLTGTTVSVGVSTTDFVAAGPGLDQPVTLSLNLQDDQGGNVQIRLGRLRPGTSPSKPMSASVHCETGCLLAGVSLDTYPGTSMSGMVTLSELTSSAGKPVPIGPAARWIGLNSPALGSMTPSSSTTGRLAVSVDSSGISHVTMRQAWFPATIPSLVAGDLPPGSVGNKFQATGLDLREREGLRVAAVSRVPAAPPNTSLINLDTAQRGSRVDPADVIQVWFAHDDRTELKRVVQALRGQGVQVARVTSLSDQRGTYDESTAAWSLQLGVVVGLAGLLIALLVLLVIAVTTWRLRSRDLAALRMSGMSMRTVRSIAAVEQLPAIVLGVLAGAVCGVVGAHYALPTVPLFATAPVVSTLDLSTAWPAVASATLGALLVLAVLGWLVGRAIAGRATLERVRETQ